MKKILVICQNYPSLKNPFSQTFIHYRLKEYIRHYQVDVLSFAAKDDYVYDGVRVSSEASIKHKLKTERYDAIISHAPNIRNHQRFLLTNLFTFKSILFIFHGYEVIDIVKRVYGQPTHYVFPHTVPFLSRVYHKLKLPITYLLLKLISSIVMSKFVFVSNSLLKEVQEDIGGSLFVKGANTFVVHNPINPKFHTERFVSSGKFDFVCIRPFNDPKYGVDIFVKLAQKNPQSSFHLYGNGEFPRIENLPLNLKVISKFIHSDEIPKVLKDFKAAILPTRWDSQGVLACEIAAQGMPLITSDLDVCREMLGNYKNVIMVSNLHFHELDLSIFDLENDWSPQNIFSHENTTNHEISILKKLISEAGSKF